MNSIDDVLEQRGNQYGSFVTHAQITQDLKAIIEDALDETLTILEPDQAEALDMILHKIARIINGNPDYIDSWVDIAGYATLVANRLKEDEEDALEDFKEVLNG